MSCYDCGNRGWMDTDEFRERLSPEEVLGNEAPLYFLTTGKHEFETGICPSCEGAPFLWQKIR